MVSRDIAKGLVAVLGGMILFKGSSNIDFVENLFVSYPLIAVGVGFALFFWRDKIATYFFGAK